MFWRAEYRQQRSAGLEERIVPVLKHGYNIANGQPGFVAPGRD